MTRCFTEMNGRSSSSHWVISMSSCQHSRCSRISRRSKVRRGDKAEIQTWASDESCQSDGLHEIVRSIWLLSIACGKTIMMETDPSPNWMSADWGVLKFSVRLIKWRSSGVSKISCLKNFITMWQSSGTSIWEMRSSKYSLTPSK